MQDDGSGTMNNAVTSHYIAGHMKEASWNSEHQLNLLILLKLKRVVKPFRVGLGTPKLFPYTFSAWNSTKDGLV
jgi:hypothetical protein